MWFRRRGRSTAEFNAGFTEDRDAVLGFSLSAPLHGSVGMTGNDNLPDTSLGRGTSVCTRKLEYRLGLGLDALPPIWLRSRLLSPVI